MAHQPCEKIETRMVKKKIGERCSNFCRHLPCVEIHTTVAGQKNRLSASIAASNGLSAHFTVRRVWRRRMEGFVQHNLEDWIRERAHAIWEAQGHPEGLAEEHWRQAAEEVSHVDKLAELPAPLATGAAAKALTKTRAPKTKI